MKFKLVVFDLDFTLWNAGGTWCDHTYPPYKKYNGQILDAQNTKIFLYNDTKNILRELYHRDIKLAVASRTHEPAIAKELMRLFEIDRFFHFSQIFPGSKISHFEALQRETKIPFHEMIFFDDEHRNVADVSQLGVQCVRVHNGISNSLVNNYLT